MKDYASKTAFFFWYHNQGCMGDTMTLLLLPFSIIQSKSI